MTHYLHFESEEAFLEAAREADFITTDEDGNEIVSCYTHDHAIDIIGLLYNDDAEYGPEGELIKEATLIPGWHVNAKFKDVPRSMAPFEVTPKSPQRRFAGD